MSQNYNSTAVLAIKASDCVAIVSSTSYNNNLSFLTRSASHIHSLTNTLYVSFPGIYTDAITLAKTMKNKVEKFEIENSKEINARQFSKYLSHSLYKKRFSPYMVSPVIAGFDENDKPYISSMDLIGAASEDGNFIAA